jgi:hypothetical protein
VTNPARRDSYLDTHVTSAGICARPGMERRPPGVWGAAVEIRDDRIIRQWSGERGWVEENANNPR